MTKRQLELVERNKKIISLWLDGHKQTDIVELITTLGYPEVKQSQISAIVKGHEREVDTSSYVSKKVVSTEKSLQRQRNESNYLRKVNRDIYKEEIIKEDIEDTIDRLVRVEIKPIEIKKYTCKQTGVKLFHFSDLHLGKKGTTILQSKEKLTIKQRLDIMFTDILECPENTIYLVNTGDLFNDLVQDGMHSGSKLTQELQFAEDNINYAVNVFSELYERLAEKKKKVISLFIGGNHDRFAQKNENEVGRLGMYTFVSILKQRFYKNENFTWEYNSKDTRLYFEDENFALLLSHGENKHNITKVQDFRTLQDLQTSKHLLVLSGHRHQFDIENGYRTTKIIAPSLAGIGDYDYKLGFVSNNGYVVITNENNLPSIQVKYTD